MEAMMTCAMTSLDVDTPAISVRGLTKRYGARTVVDQLDIDVPRGSIAGFVGPNGAGKTTTMAMLLGLVRPSSGSGEVLGKPIGSPSAYLPRVGALIESPAFYASLTGRENLRHFATVGGHDERRIETVLTEVGLTDRDGDRGDDRYRSYSLGMKQRLGIAAGLLGDPDLLILDEPANGLDPEGVREMRSLLGRMTNTGRTVLVSSHDLSELEQVCDWLVLIDTGRSLYQGTTADLLNSGAAQEVMVVPLDANDRARLADLLVGHGHTVVPDGRALLVAAPRITEAERPLELLAADVNRSAFEAGITLVELTPRRMSLEDRFLAMIGSSA
jgi:ABC-2 type transport system ATP-binding protein